MGTSVSLLNQTRLERDRIRQAVHVSQSCDAPGIVLHRAPFALVVFRCSLSARGKVLSCFHSSASASQYFISEYSIALLASAACSRHMASNAVNCFFEYMVVPVIALSLCSAHLGELALCCTRALPVNA
jgi:hypothetical protein